MRAKVTCKLNISKILQSKGCPHGWELQSPEGFNTTSFKWHQRIVRQTVDAHIFLQNKFGQRHCIRVAHQCRCAALTVSDKRCTLICQDSPQRITVRYCLDPRSDRADTDTVNAEMHLLQRQFMRHEIAKPCLFQPAKLPVENQTPVSKCV